MSRYFHLKTCVFVTLISFHISKNCFFFNYTVLLEEIATSGPFKSSSLFRNTAMGYEVKGTAVTTLKMTSRTGLYLEW